MAFGEDSTNIICCDETNEFDCYSFFDLDLSDWKFIDDEQLVYYCQPTSTKIENRYVYECACILLCTV